MRNDYNYFRNVIIIIERIGKSLFICVVNVRKT